MKGKDTRGACRVIMKILAAAVLSCQASVFAETKDIISEVMVNPQLAEIKNNRPVGWELRNEAKVEYDSEKGAAVLHTEKAWNRINQEFNLDPGHYLFRIFARTNVRGMGIWIRPENRRAVARMPIGVSADYEWTEMPFFVDGPGEGGKSMLLEIICLGSTAPGKTYIKKLELLRLGDTVLPSKWGEHFTPHPLHGLETLNEHPVWELDGVTGSPFFIGVEPGREHPEWDRPGRVIFKDSFLGTELWMMTRSGQVDLSYAGMPDFSHNGKYVMTGRRRPGYVMRTDGSYRFVPPAIRGPEVWSRKILWPYPWERKRIPEGTDASDWIVTSRSTSSIEMLNLATGNTHTIKMPVREGWTIISFPSRKEGGYGVNIWDTTHETLVWYSGDKKHIGLSDAEGKNFRSFRIKSVSGKPERDTPIRISGGLAVDISLGFWINPVDENGRHYFVFDLNRGKPVSDPDNPYQVWAIALNEKDTRGLLRAVMPEPGITVPHDTPGLPSHYYNTRSPQMSLLLEDGTAVYGSKLGTHTTYKATIKVPDIYKNRDRFIGTYPMPTGSADRISWPHEFRLDRDFAVLEAITDTVPFGPLVMIDLEHDNLWTLVLTNYHDYAIRYAQRGMYMNKPTFGLYDKPMFRHAPPPSPDFTKVIYNSSMLTGDHPAQRWGDAYIAVARYPQPPVNARLEGRELAWEKPRYSRETRGVNIYRSEESGGNTWTKINGEPVTGTRYRLEGRPSGFYVLTSVEYSGLESRNFSNEVSAGRNRVFRHFYQPAEGRIVKPMVPVFEPHNASNMYAVALTDPELLYREKLKEGLKGSVSVDAEIPAGGRWRILARVRGMFGLERSTYTTGWHPSGEHATGTFTVEVNGKPAGKIAVEDFTWRWVELDTGGVNLASGKAEIRFSTGNAGIAVDNILVTNDPGFIPGNMDNTPVAKPSLPSKLRVDAIDADTESQPLEWHGYRIKPPYVKIAWENSAAPQGTRYYNIYRGRENGFKADASTLIGSSHEPFFFDRGLKKGEEYMYRVIAVDNWDNRSEPSAVLAVRIE